MSIVLCAINKGTATIMSDGKITNTYCAYNQENKCKFQHLTNDVIIGYTGELNPCEEAISWFKNHLLNNPFADVYNFQKYLIDLNDKHERTFLMVGKYNNKIHLLTFGSESKYQFVVNQILGKEDFYYTAIGTSSINSINLDTYMLMSLPLETKMKMCIESIANYDQSVNKTIFTDTISL